jgi:hypothetical protein
MWSWSGTCTTISLANRKQIPPASASDESNSGGKVDVVNSAETFQSAVRDAQARSNPIPTPPQEAPDLRALTAGAISISPSSVRADTFSPLRCITYNNSHYAFRLEILNIKFLKLLVV